MLQKLKSKGFLCFAVFFGLGLVFLFLIFLMYQLGFRITYVPDLENNWEAISGTDSKGGWEHAQNVQII